MFRGCCNTILWYCSHVYYCTFHEQAPQRETNSMCQSHEHLSPAYVIYVWTVHLIFTQKMSHREQGVSVTSCLSMHMIHIFSTFFTFTSIHMHPNTPRTQSVHVLLKLTMDKSDTQKVIMRENALPPTQSSMSTATVQNMRSY